MTKKAPASKTHPTRDKILSAAFQLFIERGYEGASLNNIVSASGVSKGAFYHYFPSKLSVFQHTVDTFFLMPFDNFNMNKLAKLSPRKARAALRQHYASLPEQLSAVTDQHFARVYALMFDSFARLPEFHQDIGRVYSKLIKALAIAFETPKTSPKAAKKKALKFVSQLEGEIFLQAVQNSSKT